MVATAAATRLTPRLPASVVTMIAALAFALLLLPAEPAQAATFTVNSTVDAVDATPGDGACDDGAGSCTLRAAIMEANASAGADTITLPAGAYVLTIPGTAENSSAIGDLDIIGDLTIAGASAALTTIDGGALDRVFHVRPLAVATISDVTVTNGASAFGEGPLGGHGGGILNEGTLTLTDSVVNGNTASQTGGGLAHFAGNEFLTIRGSTVSGNSTTGFGGGIFSFGILKLRDSTVAGNSAARGGGVHYEGGSFFRDAIRGSTISGNTASLNGGGLHNTGGAHGRSLPTAPSAGTVRAGTAAVSTRVRLPAR